MSTPEINPAPYRSEQKIGPAVKKNIDRKVLDRHLFQFIQREGDTKAQMDVVQAYAEDAGMEVDETAKILIEGAKPVSQRRAA